MHPTKIKTLRIAGYSIALLAVCAFLGWHVLFPAGDYQDRLRLTGQNLTQLAKAPDLAQSLKVYAVNVVHTPPFKKPFVGYGIYLGNGAVLTAAHVVGHWPSLTNPRVLVAGQDLAAKVVKLGSLVSVDLALLSIDESRLPVSLRLRRSPLCKPPLRVGINVAVVTPDKSEPSRVISPQQILPQYRARFPSLIDDVEPSGSGVFDVARGCLLGIISRTVEKVSYRQVDRHVAAEPGGYAGYFVSAAKIAGFLPDGFDF
jgi:hypothetical protein